MDFSAIQDEILEQAREQLDQLCGTLAVPTDHRHLVTGRPESEIPTQAKALGDLIVLGSHARWGWRSCWAQRLMASCMALTATCWRSKSIPSPRRPDRSIRGQKLSELRAIKRPPQLTTRRVSHHRNPHAVALH